LLDPAASDRTPVRFAPAELGGYQPAFRSLLRQLVEVPAAARLDVLRDALAEVGELKILPALRYRASLSVLEDLIAQGWDLEWMAGLAYVRPPSQFAVGHDLHAAKARQRSALQVARRDQLAQPAVRNFLADLEADPRFRGMVASGEELHARLKKRGEAAVEPYLQVVDGDRRDPISGLRAMDIWRYFRHTWSTPYRPTPGRNLFFLVRDAAVPSHPVMGIAALGNSVIQIRDRDEFIGWTLSALRERVGHFDEGEADLLWVRLRGALSTALASVTVEGLGFGRRLLASNPEEAMRRAEAVAYEAASRRRAALTAQFAEEDANWGDDDLASAELFKAKRAEEVATLLRAELLLRSYDELEGGSCQRFLLALRDEAAQAALSTCLRTIKKTHVGTSLMEIIVCGGVPPYNEILVGKLVALMMCSPEVRWHYTQRYAGQASEIASRMRGRHLHRPADLVYLGTTSLYGVGSSQYNRLKVHPSVLGGAGSRFLEYRELGVTRGFGSTQFSNRTRGLLGEIVVHGTGRREIRNRFGEGVSPGLRRIRMGLEHLRLDSDRLLRHYSSRLVYGVCLADNTEAYLRGEDDTPRFLLPSATSLAQAQASTRLITRYWKDRWLAPRLHYAPALERMRATSDRMFPELFHG